MITIVLTCRDREISIIKKCLASLWSQSNKKFKIVLVNYGSTINYSEMFELFLKENSSVEYINCDVSQQLWNKSRAINIALKKCDTRYFFVADIDMIFREDFIDRLYEIGNEDKATYFQVGFLDKEQTEKELSFAEYKINFNSNAEATGMTLYPTNLLIEINGYDEFYHGWGSEDTDVHCRLRSSGKTIEYYDKEVLILHQWHPKFYRSAKNKAPFHSSLEQINSKYLQQVKALKKIKANLNDGWGLFPINLQLENRIEIEISNVEAEFLAFAKGIMPEIKDKVLFLSIKLHPEYKSIKQTLKKTTGKKTISFLSMQEMNDMLLMEIIVNYRNCPYEYEWRETDKMILLKISL